MSQARLRLTLWWRKDAGEAMERRIGFVEPTYYDSRGRNGTVLTHGVQVMLIGETADGQNGEACIRPVTSRGVVSDSARVVIDSEAMGEVAAAFAECFARFATHEARMALADRLTHICRTGTDPEHPDEPAGAPDWTLPGKAL